MPVTGWVKAQSVTGTDWTALIGGETLLDGVAAPNDGSRDLHSGTDIDTEPLICTDYDFTSEGIVSDDVIELIEFECYGSTMLAHVTPGSTIGVDITLDGSTGEGLEEEFDSDGPGMQSAVLEFVPGLTGADILTSTFGFLIKRGTNSGGSPSNYGRHIDYERARITYSNAAPSPVPVMASKHRRIPDLGAIRNKGLGEKTT